MTHNRCMFALLDFHNNVLNVTSMSGLVAFPMVGIYNASKFAMEAVTESLAQEVKDSASKSRQLSQGCLRLTGSAVRCAEWNRIFWITRLPKRHDETPLPWNGDLAKAAQAMLTIIAAENPPGHVLLGSIADRLVGQKLENLRKESRPAKNSPLGPTLYN